MVRRVIEVHEDDEPGRVPRALPPGPVRPDPDPSTLPALPALPALSEDERLSIGARELAARFLLGYSPQSARSRASCLRDYFNHCTLAGRDPLSVDEEFVANYAADLERNEQLNASSIGLRLSVVRAFYRFATEDQLLTASPAEVTATRAHAVMRPPLVIDSRATDAHEAAAAFLLGYREQTRRLYASELRGFFGWCFRARINPLEATRPHIEAWRLHLENEESKAASSSNRALSAIRSFYKYCIEEEILDKSPAASVRQRRLNQNKPLNEGLDRHESLIFLDAAREASPIYHAVMTLMVLNGLRAGEVCSPDVERMTTVRGHRLIHVNRKGYADQWPVPLAPYTAGVLDAYLEVRPAHISPGHPDWTV